LDKATSYAQDHDIIVLDFRIHIACVRRRGHLAYSAHNLSNIGGMLLFGISGLVAFLWGRWRSYGNRVAINEPQHSILANN
jgi:hypothetical protein